MEQLSKAVLLAQLENEKRRATLLEVQMENEALSRKIMRLTLEEAERVARASRASFPFGN